MKGLMKNLGVIILLIGVIILAVPSFQDGASNAVLIAGLAVIIIGYLAHIFFNKKYE
jgi:hypothetical protein